MNVWYASIPLAAQEGSTGWISILFIVGLIVLFYFMLIRPQQKRMRQQMELMKSLRVGDEVMTSAGIYGTISEVEEDTVLLEVAEDVDIRVAKSAIVKIFTPHEQEEAEEGLSGEEEADKRAEDED
ncbi:preprotein translocase subunit YajC [Candidatus Solincola sp.]|jgi:preprotein translocase subunit YajC|nr:preprotein translocase subunit YajC [Actinomycetota bacterium]MDI7252049.1 preprotein translocase subunit YajC [Actinomycetota bacterium]